MNLGERHLGETFVRRTFPAVVLAVAVGSLVGCPEKPQAKDQVAVAATIHPLADLARQVGGGRVRVTTIVPPGVSEHGFDPNTQARRAVALGALVLTAGPTDEWFEPSMMGKGAILLDLEDVLVERKLLPAGEKHAGRAPHGREEESHEHEDPHYWLDPNNMAVLAEEAGEALARLAPAHEAEFLRQSASYAAQCRELAAQMRAEAAGFRHKNFIAEHPAYGVMAQAMGLRQVASIRPVVGVSMTPRHLGELADQIVRMDVPAVFTEPQLPGGDAEALQQEAARRGRSLKILMLDPLGSPSVPGRETYLENMRANLSALREGLGD